MILMVSKSAEGGDNVWKNIPSLESGWNTFSDEDLKSRYGNVNDNELAKRIVDTMNYLLNECDVQTGATSSSFTLSGIGLGARFVSNQLAVMARYAWSDLQVLLAEWERRNPDQDVKKLMETLSLPENARWVSYAPFYGFLRAALRQKDVLNAKGARKEFVGLASATMDFEPPKRNLSDMAIQVKDATRLAARSIFGKPIKALRKFVGKNQPKKDT